MHVKVHTFFGSDKSSRNGEWTSCHCHGSNAELVSVMGQQEVEVILLTLRDERKLSCGIDLCHRYVVLSDHPVLVHWQWSVPCEAGQRASQDFSTDVTRSRGGSCTGEEVEGNRVRYHMYVREIRMVKRLMS